jgi:hypothetical protein
MVVDFHSHTVPSGIAKVGKSLSAADKKKILEDNVKPPLKTR